MSGRWDLHPLGEVVDLVGGGTPSKHEPSYWEGGIPWVSPKDMKQTEIADSKDHINEEAVKKSAAKLIPPNAILVVVRGMILARTFPIAITRAPLAINQDMKALICRDATLPEFVAYMLRALETEILGKVQTSTHGTRRLQTKDLVSLLIPVPSPQDQERIVAKLDACFSRIIGIRSSPAQGTMPDRLSAVLEATLARAFPEHGKPLSTPWRWITLDSVAEAQTGTWGPEAAGDEKGVPVIRSTEIRGLTLDAAAASVRSLDINESKRHELTSGDILVNKSSGSRHLVGWPAIFEHPGDGRRYLFSNFMLRLRFEKRIDPWFALYYLHSPQARRRYLEAQDTTSGLRNLRAHSFLSQPFPEAPITYQRRLVSLVASIRDQLASLVSEHSQVHLLVGKLERSILERAFQGNL